MVGKLSVLLGLCLEALVNTISSGRYMILTVHNRELVLLRYQVKQLCLLCVCVYDLAQSEAR